MSPASDYKTTLKDQESLESFVKSLQDFNQRFCDLMASGSDYTLHIEVHGNAGRLIHVRVKSDSFQRPRESKQKSPDS